MLLDQPVLQQPDFQTSHCARYLCNKTLMHTPLLIWACPRSTSMFRTEKQLQQTPFFLQGMLICWFDPALDKRGVSRAVLNTHFSARL